MKRFGWTIEQFADDEVGDEGHNSAPSWFLFKQWCGQGYELTYARDGTVYALRRRVWGRV